VAKDLILDVIAKKNSKELSVLADEFEKAAKNTDEFGKKLDKSTTFSKYLDDELGRTKVKVKELGEEFDRTGNKDVFGALKGAQRNVQALEKIKADLSAALEDGGRQGAPRFWKAIGATVGATLPVALAGALPAVGAVVAGALGLGGGLVGIGGAVALQLRDPAVKRAATDLGHELATDLTAATSAFGPRLITGLGALRETMHGQIPGLADALGPLASSVTTLTTGLGGLVREMLPGLGSFFSASAPVISQFARDLPGIGAAFTSMFESLASNAAGAVAGMHAFDTVLSGTLTGVGRLFGSLAGDFAALPAGVQTGALSLAVLGAAVFGITRLTGGLSGSLGGLAERLREQGQLGQVAASGVDAFSKSAVRLTVILGALQIASMALGSNSTVGVNRTTQALDAFATSGDRSSESLKHLDYDLGTLGSGGGAKFGNWIAGTVEGFTGLGAVMDESLTHAKQRIGELDQAMAAEVSGGHAAEAARQFDMLTVAAQQQGISVDDLKRGLPLYEDALAGASTATRTTTVDLYAMRTATQAARDAERDLTAEFDKLFGAQMSLDEANLRFKDGMLKLRKEIERNGTSLQDNSLAGLANRQVILGLIKDAEAARQAAIDHAGGVDASADAIHAANVAYGENLRKLEALGVQLGLRKQDLDAIVGTYNINVVVKTTGFAPTHINPDGSVTVGRMKAFAAGGRYEAGQPRLIGENGPEIDVPDHGGVVIPNVPTAGRSYGQTWGSSAAAGDGWNPTGGSANQVQVVLSAADPQAAWLLTHLRATIAARGGSVQRVIGARGVSS
jgi:hypothetical protein